MPESRGLGVLGNNLLDVGKEAFAGLADLALSVVQPGPGSPLEGTAFNNLISRAREGLPDTGNVGAKAAAMLLPFPKDVGKLLRKGAADTFDEAAFLIHPKAVKDRTTKAVFKAKSPDDIHQQIARRGGITQYDYDEGYLVGGEFRTLSHKDLSDFMNGAREYSQFITKLSRR